MGMPRCLLGGGTHYISRRSLRGRFGGRRWRMGRGQLFLLGIGVCGARASGRDVCTVS